MSRTSWIKLNKTNFFNFTDTLRPIIYIIIFTKHIDSPLSFPPRRPNAIHLYFYISQNKFFFKSTFPQKKKTVFCAVFRFYKKQQAAGSTCRLLSYTFIKLSQSPATDPLHRECFYTSSEQIRIWALGIQLWFSLRLVCSLVCTSLKAFTHIDTQI